MSKLFSFRSFLFLIVVSSLFIFVSYSSAITRSKLCKPAKLCDPIKEVPKQVRKLIDSDQGLVWSTPRIASRDFSIDEGGASPQFQIPANKKITQVCDSVRGTLKCYDIVTLDGCPNHARFNVTVGGVSTVAECDLVCIPNTPDPNTGNCECSTTNCVYS